MKHARTTSGRGWLCFLVLLGLISSAIAAQSVIAIQADAPPESNSSLEYYLCGEGSSELAPSTTLQLSQGIHYLTEGQFCMLQNLEDISIQGQAAYSTTIKCIDSSDDMRRGIGFFNVSNLIVANVTITNCGGEIHSKLPGDVNNTFAYIGTSQKAVLLFTHCTNTLLDTLTIDQCFGFGMLIIVSMGQMLAQDVVVMNTNNGKLIYCTQPLYHPDLSCSGSGIVIIYDDTDITRSLIRDDSNYLNTSLHINGCSFINNTNHIPVIRFSQLLNIIGVGFETQPILVTGSSGLAVYIGQREYFVDVSITNTTVISNYGTIGGLSLLYYNTLYTSRTILDRVVVYNNSVENIDRLGRGGGINIVVLIFFDALHSFESLFSEVFDIVEITRSNFSHNAAFYGGAILFYTTPQNITDIRLIIRETDFMGNVARFGAVFYSFRFQSSNPSRAIYVYIEDVIGMNNTFFNEEISTNSPEDAAAFLVNQLNNVTVVGTQGKGCYFHGNDVSVFGASGTDIILRGVISFVENRGFTGGALSLLDSSVLFIYSGSTLNFIRNSAFTRGGAIYSNTLGTSVTQTCAIQFLGETRIQLTPQDLTQLDVSIVFSNNSALSAGNSIYGNPLYFCLFIPTSAVDHVKLFALEETILYEETLQFTSSVNNRISEITSVPVMICICQNEVYTTDDCDNIYLMLDYEIIPGDTLIMFLNPADVIRTPVASLLYAEVINQPIDTDSITVLDFNEYVRPLLGLTECERVKFTIFAVENIRVHLNLFVTLGGQKVTIEFNTTSCPPGFMLGSNADRPACVCSDFVKNTLGSTCDLTQYTIARPDNYWIGTSSENSSILRFVSTCPINYCREDITDLDLRIPDQLCASGRTGVLCGACKEGLSTIFGLSECRKCSNAWLVMFILYALLGFLVVFFAFLLDLTITQGTINGIVFYANVFLVNANIFYFQGGRSNFLHWFISWLNLEVGFPMCFYDGMSETAKLGLNYVFPTYIIAILILIIVLSKRSLVIQRVLSRLDGVHALVSILYLSFLKILRTVIDTATFVSIVTETKEHHDEFVWFYDGTERGSSPDAISLMTLGLITTLVFLLPYVIFFTFSTYIQRCVNSISLNLYVDATTAPYKLKFRFWFGARLILTYILYGIIANRGTNNPRLTLTLELSQLIAFVIIQVYIRPFKKLGISLLDLSFFVNLIALMLGTSYNIQSSNRGDNQRILVNLSLGVAVITYVGIILYHSWIRLNKVDKIRMKTDKLIVKATDIYTGLKLKVKRSMMKTTEDVRQETDGSSSVPQGVQYLKKPNDIIIKGLSSTTTSSHIELTDMIEAPDNINDERTQHLSSSQLREPVLDFLSVPDTLIDRHTT